MENTPIKVALPSKTLTIGKCVAKAGCANAAVTIHDTGNYSNFIQSATRQCSDSADEGSTSNHWGITSFDAHGGHIDGYTWTI